MCSSDLNFVYKFVEFMSKYYMNNLCERYNLTEKFDEIIQVIEQIAVNRGKVLKGNRIDYFSVSNSCRNYRSFFAGL